MVNVIIMFLVLTETIRHRLIVQFEVIKKINDNNNARALEEMLLKIPYHFDFHILLFIDKNLN